MHDLIALLNDILKGGAIWIWSKEYKDTFQKIKSYLLLDLLLAHFEPKKRDNIASDTNIYGIGVVILHKFKDRTTKLINHASRTLLPAGRN